MWRDRGLCLLVSAVILAAQVLPAAAPAVTADAFAQARKKMLVDIQANAAGLSRG
jgi:hypothetical protein